MHPARDALVRYGAALWSNVANLVTLGYEPGPLLDDRFYAVYSKLCEISNLPLNAQAEAMLTAIMVDLRQNLFLPRKQTAKEVALSLQQDSGQ